MHLHYYWENVEVNYECDYGGYSLSPHTRTRVQDVEYDFYVDIQDEDIIEYINGDKETSIRLLDLLHNCIDYDYLEEDDDFVDFMKEKYEDEAWEEWEEGNDAY